MNQVRILSVKTGLVALIPSWSIVRPDCFVRGTRAERLYVEALTAENALGQEYNQTKHRVCEAYGHSQLSATIESSDKLVSAFHPESRYSACPNCLMGLPGKRTIRSSLLSIALKP
jgi:hypothetical protein